MFTLVYDSSSRLTNIIENTYIKGSNTILNGEEHSTTDIAYQNMEFIYGEITEEEVAIRVAEIQAMPEGSTT